MQVRKRAKSVSFGKHEKTKEPEKVVNEVKLHHEPKPEEKVVEPTPAAKKVQEPSLVVEKTEELVTPPELPEETLEEKEAEEVQPPTVTPPSEFLSDTPTPVSASETDSLAKPTDPMVVEPVTTSTPVPEATPEAKPAESELSGVLSPTPPTSAFTIQGGNVESEPKEEGKKKHFVLYFFVVALISFILGLGAMAGVSYFGLLKVPFSVNTQMLTKMNPLNPTPTSIPTTVPTAAPTAKPADLKSYTISVLNGSGIKGKAADVKTSLTAAGFKVGTTGNADKSDYTTTQIAAKKNVDKAYLDKLQEELKKTYKLDPISTIPSDSTQPTDVIVTLGQESN